jgi:hypothetical protein
MYQTGKLEVIEFMYLDSSFSEIDDFLDHMYVSRRH